MSHVVFQKKNAELEGKSERYALLAFGGLQNLLGGGWGAGPGTPRAASPPGLRGTLSPAAPQPAQPSRVLQPCKTQSPTQGDAALSRVGPHLYRWCPHTPVHVTHLVCSLHLRAPQQGQTALPFQPGLVNAGDAICQRSAAPDAWGSGGSLASQTCPTELAAAGV